MKKFLMFFICFFTASAQAQMPSPKVLCANPQKNKAEILAVPDQIKAMVSCQGKLRLAACLGVVGFGFGATMSAHQWAEDDRFEAIFEKARAKLGTYDIDRQLELAKSEYTTWKLKHPEAPKKTFEQLTPKEQTEYIQRAQVKIDAIKATKAGKALEGNVTLEDLKLYSKLAPEAAIDETGSLWSFLAKNPRALSALVAGGVVDTVALALIAEGLKQSISNTGCDELSYRYTNIDENCKPVYEINEDVAKLLDSDKKFQEKNLLSDRSRCEYYAQLRNRILEKPIVKTGDVRCDRDGMRIPLANNSYYDVSYYAGTKNVKTISLNKPDYGNAISAKTGRPFFESSTASINKDGTLASGDLVVFMDAMKTVPVVNVCCAADGDERKQLFNYFWGGHDGQQGKTQSQSNH